MRLWQHLSFRMLVYGVAVCLTALCSAPAFSTNPAPPELQASFGPNVNVLPTGATWKSSMQLSASTTLAAAAKPDKYVCNHVKRYKLGAKDFAVFFNDDGLITADPSMTGIDAMDIFPFHTTWGMRSLHLYTPIEDQKHEDVWVFKGINDRSKLISAQACYAQIDLWTWTLFGSYWADPVKDNEVELEQYPVGPAGTFTFTARMQGIWRKK